MDTLTRTERSKRMALIHSRDTKPELLVRKIARSCGHRFRLHVSDLPGKPDLVFPKLRKVIFVHGCYWHRHPGCSLARLPKSKLRFWIPKLTENRRRDLRNIAPLRREEWKADGRRGMLFEILSSLEKSIIRFLSGVIQNVELYTGAGGLALEMSNAGFHQAVPIKRDHAATRRSARISHITCTSWSVSHDAQN